MYPLSNIVHEDVQLPKEVYEKLGEDALSPPYNTLWTFDKRKKWLRKTWNVYKYRPNERPPNKIVDIVPTKSVLNDGCGLNYFHWTDTTLLTPQAYEHVVLIAAGCKDYAVIAHEIGHTYGLDDKYTDIIQGENATKGWCLNIENGESCEKELSNPFNWVVSKLLVEGVRVNVASEGMNWFTEEIEGIYYPFFYDMMGSEGTAAWIHKEHYKKLMEKLTE